MPLERRDAAHVNRLGVSENDARVSPVHTSSSVGRSSLTRRMATSTGHARRCPPRSSLTRTSVHGLSTNGVKRPGTKHHGPDEPQPNALLRPHEVIPSHTTRTSNYGFVIMWSWVRFHTRLARRDASRDPKALRRPADNRIRVIQPPRHLPPGCGFFCGEEIASPRSGPAGAVSGCRCRTRCPRGRPSSSSGCHRSLRR